MYICNETKINCQKKFRNESTAGADASVEASYNVASKKKPGDRSSDSLAVAS